MVKLRQGLRDMKMNPLGRTGMMVSELCLGTMTFGTQTSEADAHAQIDMALAAGVNFVDTAEIEDIRGVAVAKGTVDTLLEAGWIKPRGRKQTPGRPLMWGTTDAFLDHFGLSTVKELPGMDELKAAGLLDKREGLASLPTSEEDNDDETETELEMEDGEETGDAGTSADVIQLDQAR